MRNELHTLLTWQGFEERGPLNLGPSLCVRMSHDMLSCRMPNFWANESHNGTAESAMGPVVLIECDQQVASLQLSAQQHRSHWSPWHQAWCWKLLECRAMQGPCRWLQHTNIHETQLAVRINMCLYFNTSFIIWPWLWALQRQSAQGFRSSKPLLRQQHAHIRTQAK